MEGDELKAAKELALEKANENLQMLKEGKLEIKSASSPKASAPRNVMTEARRIAKEIVKNQLRANNITISHVEPKVITAAANKMLEGPSGAEIIEQATTNVAAREAKAPKLDLKALGIEVSPKLVAKAEKAKAERKTQLSATQAGKVKSRKAKGAQAAAAH